MRYYVIEVYGGTEAQSSQSFDSEKDRDKHAKETWSGMNASKGDNVFWANVHSSGLLDVGPYLEGALE